MDIWQLRCFTSVAKCLNFTEAAKNLYIGQSTLSKQIANLEQQLGVQLFIRNKRSVHLTAPGTILLDEARAILEKSDQALQKVRQAASGFVGNLTIGFLGSVEKNLLPQLVRNFRVCYPNINLEMQHLNWRTVTEALYNDEIDIGFLFSLDPEDMPGLTCESIYRGVLTVVLPADHLLSQAEKISISALADEPFIICARKESPVQFDYVFRLCKKAGFTPKIVCQPNLMETVLMLVDAGLGIAISSTLAKSLINQPIRFVNIEGDPTIDLVIAWKKLNSNPAIPLFIEKLRETKLIPQCEELFS